MVKLCENMTSQLEHSYKNYFNFNSNGKSLSIETPKKISTAFLETQKKIPFPCP